MANESGVNSTSPAFTCPITGFRFCIKPKFILAAVIAIVWANLFSWFWHGNVLATNYQATPSLWRAPAEMNTGALNGGMALMAFFATYIFSIGYKGTGWKEGLRFGILLTLFLFGLGLITYATQPIPFEIIKMWTLGDFIMYTVTGIFLSIFFRPRSSME